MNLLPYSAAAVPPLAAGFDVRLALSRTNRRIDSPFARDVVAGLSRPRKAIPCTWLYDRRGAALFEQITHLQEYYPTRTEIAILEESAASIAAIAGPGATLVELGSGSGRKTPILLAALDRPEGYVPIDISVECLADSVCALRAVFPRIPIRPIFGDLRASQTLRRIHGEPGQARRGRHVGFFPGSTVGNFEPTAAVALLERIGATLGDDALLVIGVDSTVNRALLMPAYDDRAGVTAAFNLNLLSRINRELEGSFDPAAFEHQVRFDVGQRRMEMHLVSRGWAEVEVLGRRFVFAAGESIHTENSYKYSPARFQALARRAHWRPVSLWSDGHSGYGVHVFERSVRHADAARAE
jgi:dimethylhistidine N-methyltransferase